MHLKKKKEIKKQEPRKSKKNIKTLQQTPAVLKNRSSNLPDRSVPKGPAQNQTDQHYSKNPKLVPTIGKHQKSKKKYQQNLKKVLKYSNKPCSIEKWVFQYTRLKRAKKPCPK